MNLLGSSVYWGDKLLQRNGRRLIDGMIADTVVLVSGVPSAAFADPVPVGMASDGTPIVASESDAEEAEVTQPIEISEPGLAPQAVFCDQGWAKSMSKYSNCQTAKSMSGVASRQSNQSQGCRRSANVDQRGPAW